ncbi:MULTISPECIES: YbaB/EbfC family nucleoid-associated protein [Rhodococcus]|uniref:YbaB/EbfC family nucleoid-associated protein n=1 Tax=Rhodococcus oxybenzonivorans TaxID=1990687 RepID=A0AAE4V2X6_9NOCA|nr:MULTISPECIES: YbaB/EbfC family nucleoid-associated protein [Rhodococcus]MDV7242938.1 YbaB/EbfC family nucleoid-associated protein [Rhodococcus oxybenzonivorans]MDV7267628.1 YbaB/EbfC family nucleoid-associated protein [Rhodococcus oxybenzonivorans]MDV7275342.1 YbaB/EbfC family nucleoid-associated protein [Rhodococcus oxybenzonivorans]MDV7334803.1 YbaB/EbfC family nucleoid-associated protein [Rhodococcus oxybenzonivorans]MDV7344957.1 YbaB/EbfC family nucleoid-associated protein [Rhodococcus 
MVDQAARHELRARNEELRHQIDSMLDAVRRQADSLARAKSEVERTRGSGTSGNGVVRVCVDAGGNVTAVELSPDAFKRTSPEALASSMAEAARLAVADVRERTAQVLAPVFDARADLPTLSELMPDAPRPGDPPPSADEPGWNATILRGADR